MAGPAVADEGDDPMSTTTVTMPRPTTIRRPADSAGAVAHGVAGWSTTGNDRVLVRSDLGLFGVFDGVGTERASGRAAAAAQAVVGEVVDAGRAACSDPASALRLLVDAVRAADRAVAGVAAAEPPEIRRNLGTTAAVVWLWTPPEDTGRPPTALVAHVGDSRVQLLHASAIRTLTLDHGVFGTLDDPEAWARQDRLDEADSVADLDDPLDRAAFVRRNQLAAVLTGDGFVDVRTAAVEVSPGDRLAIDSDGVHDNLTGHRLRDLLAADGTAQELADLIADESWTCADCRTCERAKADDVSVVVLSVGAGD